MLYTSFLGFAQETSIKVTFIGENEKEDEQLMMDCSTPLLYIADNSMDEGYDLWLYMLAQMEANAKDQGLDIRGVKVWMNMFWEADGSIKKITYYPKPTSKNMDFDQLTAFLTIFAEDYNLGINNKTCFSHYGSASFPINPKSIKKLEGGQ